MKAVFRCIVISSLAILAVACSNIDSVGPDQSDLFGKVEITEPLSADNLNPNFASGQKVAFKATFAKDAHWVLTLRSKTTSAYKTFEGIGKQIDMGKIVWTGTANGPYSFATGDSVYAVVNFPYSPEDSMTVKLKIQQQKNLNPTAVFVSKFNAGVGLGWFYDYPSAAINVPASTSYMTANTPYATLDGNYFSAKANSTGSINYFAFAGMKLDATNKDNYFPLYADPSKVFFNMYVYNTGVNIQVQLTEGYTDGAVRTYDVIPDWVGWKLVSIRYTDFVPAEGLSYNPQLVDGVGFVFSNKVIASGAAEAVIDNVCFTNGAPYQP